MQDKYSQLPIDHVSSSSMQLFEKCEECWKYKYIMGLKGDIPDYFKVGSEFHEEVHNYHLGKPFNADFIDPYVQAFDKNFRIKSEMAFELLDEDLPVSIVGIIDGIANIGIVDLKYMKGSIGKKRADESLQATIYIYAYYQMTGEILPFYFQCINKTNGRVSMVQTTRNEADFLDLKERITNHLDKVLTTDFTGGTGCYGHCQFAEICSKCSRN